MLIYLREALMTGKRLPYDAEAEYLESTGTQYINTGYVPNAQTRWEMTVAFKYVVGTFQCHGCIYVGTPRERFSMSLESGDKLNVSVGATDNVTRILGADQVHTMTADALNNQWTIDNSTGTFDPYSSLSNLGSIYLFARHRGTGRDAYVTNGRVYCSKIYEAGVLIQDLIPVRKGTVGYLYDRVSGKLFGNAGTGDFVLGPDVVPVEYIESHGTEYINTERPIPANFWFDATMDITGTNSTYKTLLGARVGSGTNDYQYSLEGNANNFLARYGTNSSQYFSSIPTGMTRIRVESGGKLYINESFVKQLGVSSPSDRNMYIFALNNNGTVSTRAQYIRLYSLKYGGANEEHVFLPVRVGTDATSWEGAMMDVLTRRIYRNAGTGAFTYGNDLKYPIPAS